MHMDHFSFCFSWCPQANTI